MKGPAEIVSIEPGNDDALTHIRQPDYQVNQGVTQELGFINADYFSAQIYFRLYLGSGAYTFGTNSGVVVGDNVIGGISLVKLRLENLDALPRHLSAAQTPDQLFTFSAEHRPANHFNPAKISPHCIHPEIPL